MTWRMALRTTAVAAIAVGAMAMGGGGVSAQPAPVSLEIHKAECWTGVGAAIFDECHDNRLSGVDFFISPEFDDDDVITTDSSGVAGILFAPGGVYISEEAAVTEDYLGVYVFCRDLTTDTVLWDGGLDPETGDVEIYSLVLEDLDAGSEVVCDWYNIYQGEDGGTPSNGLPSTGAGVAAGGTAPIEAMALAGLVAFAGAVTLRRRIA